MTFPSKNQEETGAYGGIGPGDPGSDSGPIRETGIGTRISDTAEVIGSRSAAADVMGVSPAALQRYISGKNMPPFDAVARLCLAANVRMEWVATGVGEMRCNPWEGAPGGAQGDASEPMRREELMMALQLASEALGRKVLPPDKHAELVTLIYEMLVEGLSEAKVMRFARPLVAAIH